METGNPIYASPLVDHGVLYIGSGDGLVYALDAASGLIGGEGCNVAVVTTAGRGYWIQLYTSGDDELAVAPYDKAWFEEVIATVQLHPEDAVD